MNTYTDTPNNIVYKVVEGFKKKKIGRSFQSDLKKTKTCWKEEDQPKYTLKSQRWPTKTNTRLTELQQGKDQNGWQSSAKKGYDLRGEKCPSYPKRIPEAFVFTFRELKGGTFSHVHGTSQAINWEPCTQNLSYYSTYVDIQYNHIYMCFLDCDKVVFYSLLYRWCKL